MKQFTMGLKKNNQRPVIDIKDETQINALLDTGAILPVWIADESLLTDYMHARLVKEDVSFGGFGGTARGKLYRLPTFTMGDLVYPGLYVVSHRMNLPFHMIVSATMLSNLKYEIDDALHRLTITIPDGQSNIRKLTIADSNGQLHVLCESGGEEEDEWD